MKKIYPDTFIYVNMLLIVLGYTSCGVDHRLPIGLYKCEVDSKIMLVTEDDVQIFKKSYSVLKGKNISDSIVFKLLGTYELDYGNEVVGHFSLSNIDTLNKICFNFDPIVDKLPLPKYCFNEIPIKKFDCVTIKSEKFSDIEIVNEKQNKLFKFEEDFNIFFNTLLINRYIYKENGNENVSVKLIFQKNNIPTDSMFINRFISTPINQFESYVLQVNSALSRSR